MQSLQSPENGGNLLFGFNHRFQLLLYLRRSCQELPSSFCVHRTERGHVCVLFVVLRVVWQPNFHDTCHQLRDLNYSHPCSLRHDSSLRAPFILHAGWWSPRSHVPPTGQVTRSLRTHENGGCEPDTLNIDGGHITTLVCGLTCGQMDLTCSVLRRAQNQGRKS